MKLFSWYVFVGAFPIIFAEKLPGSELILSEATEKNDLELLIVDVLVNSLKPFKCVLIMCDEVYYAIFKQTLFENFGVYISFILIFVEESEDLLAPSDETQESLMKAKTDGCQFYLIFLANGNQVSRLLRFGDRYRVLNTRANFMLLWDYRLFQKDLYYLWKRIVNVIFIREYEGFKMVGNVRKILPWFEISTVPFPSPIKGILLPRRLDIWRNKKFRTGVDLFRDKTSDLKNQTLRVVTFPHIPATTKMEIPEFKTVRTIMKSGDVGFSGIEIEILQTISVAMNFAPVLYEPQNIEMELWGEKQTDGQYNGMMGEMVKSSADIALGDLYYTPYFLQLLDLSIPYNSECLTFLTPESLTNNSWQTLISPFKPVMWVAIVLCLILTGFLFYALSRFHDSLNKVIYRDLMARKDSLKGQVVLANPIKLNSNLNCNAKYTLMKQQYVCPKLEGEPEGLYYFRELSNSFLYTFGMVLLVSLPKLPTGWSIRVMTGWYYLYCILLVVAYKASMTAILANPAPRVTIDTLEELVESKLACGGWGEINREFFQTSLDPASQAIGEKFEIVNDSDAAIDLISSGTFAFYENVHFLQEAAFKNQLKHHMLSITSNESLALEKMPKRDHNLHIMSDCLIHMPISIGLQKNSPIKPRVDKFIRRVFEAGLITKWLNDVMLPTINAEIHYGSEDSVKALMNLQKIFGAFVALFVGYFLSVLVLVSEILYYQLITKKHPNFDKYSKQILLVQTEDN